MATRTSGLLAVSALIGALLVYSALSAYDRPTWALEVAPVFVAFAVLGATYRRFPLTTLLYAAIAVHAVVLIVGGTYTYARVPLGFAIADLLQITRNPYDKIGHFAQGFVPALVTREILIRGGYVSARRMRDFLTVCVALAISAAYELVEWGVAVALGQGADAFLGTQGDVWDTQSDMLMALIGAIVALACCGRWHDRQIAALARRCGD